MNSEQQIHEALAELIQAIWDEERIKIESIFPRWLEIQDSERTHRRVESIKIESTSFPLEPDKPKENKA